MNQGNDSERFYLIRSSSHSRQQDQPSIQLPLSPETFTKIVLLGISHQTA